MNCRLGWRSPCIGIVLSVVVWHACENVAIGAADAQRQVAILKDEAAGIDPATADAIANALRREKFEVEFLSAEAACNAALLSPAKHFLYVIPNATAYPAAGADALARYLGRKGNLMVLGTPPFEKPIWKHEGHWVDAAFIRDSVKNQKPTRMLYDFDKETPGKATEWTQSGAHRKYTTAEIVPGGVEGSKGCLKITYDYESGSPTGCGAAVKPQAGAASGGLLCFWAKGDGQTARLAVRLIEETEPLQRGIAVISINKNWTYHVLRPEDFNVRGHADPFKARRLSFELVDRNITPYVADGKHTVWIDQIGTAPRSFPELGDTTRNPFPLIETVTPGYKLYPLTNIGSLKAVPAQAVLHAGATKLPVPSSASSCYARPEGKGFERGYKWRWIPLVRACDKDGVERGTAAWMLLHQAPLSEGPAFADAVRRLVGANIASQPVAAEGSVCAVCAISDPAALNEIARTSFLGDVARRIADGVFLSHAGSQEFSYWPGEKVRLGAVAVNHGTQPADVHVRIRVCAVGAKEAVFQKESKLAVQPGGSATASFEWAPEKFTSPSYVVTTEMLREGKTIDVIAHEMGVLSTEKAPRDSFVTTHDGDFWLEGRKWYPVGVNYWPRYSIALEQEDYTFHWLTPGFYNPEEVERDLRQLESMGATFVAIRAHHQNDRRTVLDFLRRCRNHGLRAFIFVQSHVITDDPHYFQGLMMPFHFQEKDVAEFIRATRLAENPTLMGWDLIWEPAGWVFGGKYNAFGWTDPAPYRQRWDADWARWIDERYGSVANAEADWEMSAPRIAGQVTSPSNQQFKEDGPWRVMVAAYRRFMDDLMSRHWNNAARTLHQLDPNHLISFRQGNLPPIDFTLTATPKHVDFFAMEGYEFTPGAKGTNAAGFVNRYIHFATNGKPYLWVEFGANAWNREAMQPGEKEIADQGQCVELIHRVALETGANGASPWWLAGGYRISERSDFGILNPDGTLRPSGALLQQYAALFKSPRRYPEPDTWFTLDREAHSGALFRAAYNEGAEAFGAAAAQKRQLGIRTPGTGTTSANTPLLAVGNTKYNHHNPPKYLDAEFNWFRIKATGGDWIEVRSGARIRVPQNTPVLAEASMGNLQEATWLAPASCAGKPGAVYLAATGNSALKLKQPIAKNTARLEDAEFGESFVLTEGVAAETKVELQMTAEGRVWFGEKLRFTLEPVAAGQRVSHNAAKPFAEDTNSRVTITPEIISPDQGAIQNAGVGAEIWNGGPSDGLTNLVKYAVRVSDHSVNSMIRVSWADYEAKEGEYRFQKMDKYFESCIQYGQKLDIGCFVTSAGGGGLIAGAQCSYPAYVHEAMQNSVQKDVVSPMFTDKKNRWEPNFENPYFFERYDALLKAFAEYLEQPQTFGGRTIQRKKLVRCIEMRHFGFWGEGAYPKHLVPSHSRFLIRFADAFIKHFPDIRIVVPTNGMVFIPSVYDTLKDYHFHLLTARNNAGLPGIFRDNWGWDERSGYYQKLYYSSNKYETDGVRLYELLRDRWKFAPLVGEPGRTGPKGDWRPYSCLLDQVKYLHPVVIRNCNVSVGTCTFNPTGYNVLNDPQALDNFHRMYAMIGFRYLFTSARIQRHNGDLEIAMDWLNIGLTPTYDKWRIRFFIEDSAGKETWSGFSTLDLRTVFPDENTPPGVADAHKAKTHTDRFSNTPATGKLHLQIIDPDGISPHMALSIKGRTQKESYQLSKE